MARSALTGTRIRERRTALHVKQADLARSVGISAAYLNLIEHNRRRVGDDLLETLARALGVEPVALSEGAEAVLFDGLREAAVGAEKAGPELERIEEFVGRFPGWAAVLADRQARVGALERVVEAYAERMAQDPFLLDNLHEVLSAVTSLRSTAAILAETEDIEPEWRNRFLRTMAEESLRLSGTAESLVGYLDEMETAETGLAAPLEQLETWLAGRDWHLAELETDAPPAPEALIEGVPELASAAARELALAHVARAAAEARALPLAAFSDALAELGPEPGLLAARFGVPVGMVFRRLATLPPGLPGRVPAGLVACDGSGTLTLRRPVPGFAPPRFGAACPLWPLYEALARPAQPVRAVIDMAGRLPARFLAYAWCTQHPVGGFDGPVLREAMMLLLPAPPGREGNERAVGSSCRICPRAGCPGRREPSILPER
ncbi:helix-turn-helix domain-containing protein [Sinirhodobacter ferrireducens]|uniref:Helix-turn-helix domain-containing protein n=1 Tax=Paenirhodobacter ferrireducens TaxID=1215032 RepID=A0A443LJM5_9RHOB|nr:helix-turn-helix transcriptional regulator [Sinirhodobacter ferrireducens]RWR49391.1 helix-turn-helix domain-containing protein [Sinirhodobacter ferrireducens]